jgi:hypothetical protein
MWLRKGVLPLVPAVGHGLNASTDLGSPTSSSLSCHDRPAPGFSWLLSETHTSQSPLVNSRTPAWAYRSLACCGLLTSASRADHLRAYEPMGRQDGTIRRMPTMDARATGYNVGPRSHLELSMRIWCTVFRLMTNAPYARDARTYR